MVPLCDSSGGNCCDGSSLCAGFSGNSSGGRGRGRLSSLSRLVARALPRDVTGLRALVTDLAGRAQRATVGSGAITRDVTKLSAGVALHSLSLAVTSEVVRTTTLVAGGSTRVAAKSTAETTGESSTRTTDTTASTSTSTRTSTSTSTRSGSTTVAGKVTKLVAVVATAASTTVQAQCRTVSLDVANSLAVVALLGLGRTGLRAAAGLVSSLLAVVAKTLGRRADLSVVANVATLVACTTRKQHLDCILN